MVDFSPTPTGNQDKRIKMNVRAWSIKDGLMIGQCEQFPFIIVKGKDVNELQTQVLKHLGIYLNTFPAKRRKILTSSDMVENQ